MEDKIFKQHSKAVKANKNGGVSESNDIVDISNFEDDSDSAEGPQGIIVLDSDSDDEISEKKPALPTELPPPPPEGPAPEKVSSNELTNNQDFISFDFSSDNDTDSDDNQSGGNSIYDRNDNSDDDRTFIPSIQSISSDEEYYNPATNITKKRKAKPYDEVKHKRQDISKEFPWIKTNSYKSYREMADWLTAEIKDFVAYLSPSEAEIVARNQVVSRVRKLVASIWSDAAVGVFGSYATDMYLPGSDIDMVITSPSGRLVSKSHLYQLGNLLRNDSRTYSNVLIIGKARVPIIKFVDRASNIHIDISFERANGLTAVERIRGWSQKFPCLRDLVIPIKQFLSHRQLNDVANGGMGGYSVICAIVSFLNLHPKLSSGAMDPQRNLGTLLIEFFELYGKNFNYDNVALSMNPSKMGYINKRSVYDLCHAGFKYTPYALVIQDPDDANNNISRGTYKIMNIKRAFSGAFDLITSKCYELNSLPASRRKGQSVLGVIMKLKGPERDFLDSRSKVENIAWKARDESDSEAEYSDNDNDYDPAEVITNKPSLSSSPSTEQMGTLSRVDRKTISDNTQNSKLRSFFVIDSDEENSNSNEDDNERDDDDLKYEPTSNIPTGPRSQVAPSKPQASALPEFAKEVVDISSDEEYDPSDPHLSQPNTQPLTDAEISSAEAPAAPASEPAVVESINGSSGDSNMPNDDDDYDSRTHSIRKRNKRLDYWSQKGGQVS